jgi:hypothetical protein
MVISVRAETHLGFMGLNTNYAFGNCKLSFCFLCSLKRATSVPYQKSLNANAIRCLITQPQLSELLGVW